ncbi:MAG TPA: LacI family DNA-binding transcriptional regulator [Longimicrobiales bacterium]
MAVTIKEVARRAGVSVATVSRVFNNSGPVSEETRRRIHAVAKRLRYTPNSAARSLITSRTSAVGVLLPDLYGEFFSEVIRGIDRTAQAHGYHLLVSGWHNDRAAIETMLRSMRGRVDGLIVMSPHLDARALTTNLPENLPAVLLNCPVEGDAFDALNIDNFGGAYEMVRHLVAHGHRRVALIKGAEANHDAQERQRGYRAALRDGGAEWSESLELAGDFKESSGYRAALEALALEPRPTAIFAANDSMAIGALSALRESGLSVPGEMAVAGFDDIPIARYVTPSLSSVHVAIDELGARACDRLIEAVKEKNRHQRRQEQLPTRLVLRDSCGCRDGAADRAGPTPEGPASPDELHAM